MTSSKNKHASYKVSDKDLHIVLQKSGGKLIADLFIGKRGSAYSSTLVRLSNEEEVYSVKGYIKSDWDKPITSFRDKHLLKIAKENISAIEVKTVGVNAAKSFSIFRNDLGKWMVKSQNIENNTKKNTLNRLLQLFEKLEGSSFYTENRNLPLYAKVKLILNNKQEYVLEINGPINGEKKDNNYIAKSNYLTDYIKLTKHKVDQITLDPKKLIETKKIVKPKKK